MFILAEEMRLLKASGNCFTRSLMTFALTGIDVGRDAARNHRFDHSRQHFQDTMFGCIVAGRLVWVCADGLPSYMDG
jgi:hypothetical protein